MALETEERSVPDDVSVAIDQRMELLSRVAAFTSLRAEIVSAIAPLLREQRHAAGTYVMSEGGPVDFLYIIAEGRVEISSKLSLIHI